MARRAAELAGTPRLLEASLPATAFRAARGALTLARGRFGATPPPTGPVYSRSSEITHRFVLDHAAVAAKRRALRAHASQSRSPHGTRLLDLLDRLPPAAARAVLGREWFVDPHATAGRRRDLFPLGV